MQSVISILPFTISRFTLTSASAQHVIYQIGLETLSDGTQSHTINIFKNGAKLA